MTWSITHEQEYTTTNAGNATDKEPWEYYFETFLPSKGWTVSAGETGGLDASNYPFSYNLAAFWGVSKTVTDALGNSHTRSFIVSVSFNYRYIIYWEWDGTAGGGIDVAARYDQANNYVVGGGTQTWRFLESDEDTDSWMVLTGNNVTAFNFPPSQTFLASPLVDDFPSLTSYGTNWGWQNVPSQMYGRIGGQAFGGTVYLLTPNFSWGHSVNTSTVALNSNSDLLMKFDGTTSSNVAMSASSPASFAINGTYYMDLNPSASVSFVLRTGAVDFGLF
jgi:hypothetical protein